MRYVFFGGQESEFAQIILDKLEKAGHPPLAAYRNAKENINLKKLEAYNADFFLVASFAKILKKEVINLPKKGVVGVHPSLLPKYRGASPIQSALLNNEKETGTTLFLIDEKVDHGPILAAGNLQIGTSDNYGTLLKKLAELSADLALSLIPKWLDGEIQPKIQNESEATYTEKFTADDASVDLKTGSAENIWLKIKALNPEPGVFTVLKLKNDKNLRLKLLEADFQKNSLILKKVQPEGKKIMEFKDFLNGYNKNLIYPFPPVVL